MICLKLSLCRGVFALSGRPHTTSFIPHSPYDRYTRSAKRAPTVCPCLPHKLSFVRANEPQRKGCLMRSLSVGTIVLTILCLCSSVKADELTKAEKAARDYSYKKLTFGTSLEEFKRRFPTALLMESDESSGTIAYTVFQMKGKTLLRVVRVEFFRGKLHSLMFMILPDALSKIGGRRVFEKMVQETFGAPDASKGDTHQWNFPSVKRVVTYSLDHGIAGFTVLNTSAAAEIRAVHVRNLDLGF